MCELGAVRVSPIAFTRAVRGRPVSWLLLAAPVLALLLGCPNPDYLPNGPGTCVSDRHCSAPTPICDPVTSTCVQCTPAEPSTCSGARPVCDEAGTCRACRADPECASQICQLSGNCLPEDQALYVSPMGAGDDCTALQPCSLQTALAVLTPQRFAMKLSPGTYRGAISIGNNQRLEIHGDGADLTRGGAGPILTVRGLAELTVLGLRIHHAEGAGAGRGVSCFDDLGNMPAVTLHRVQIDSNADFGIFASGCKLQVVRSKISINVGGGIWINYAPFVIVGNVFFGNGSNGLTVGGVSVSQPRMPKQLEFNTFCFNLARDGYGQAIDCPIGTFTARNNIISRNGLDTTKEQVRGCTNEYTLVYPGPALPGLGNSSADPLFENPVQGDLHLMAESPARGAADPSSALTGLAELDIDGDRRTSPADLGADEAP